MRTSLASRMDVLLCIRPVRASTTGGIWPAVDTTRALCFPSPTPTRRFGNGVGEGKHRARVVSTAGQIPPVVDARTGRIHSKTSILDAKLVLIDKRKHTGRCGIRSDHLSGFGEGGQGGAVAGKSAAGLRRTGEASERYVNRASPGHWLRSADRGMPIERVRRSGDRKPPLVGWTGVNRMGFVIRIEQTCLDEDWGRVRLTAPVNPRAGHGLGSIWRQAIIVVIAVHLPADLQLLQVVQALRGFGLGLGSGQNHAMPEQ